MLALKAASLLAVGCRVTAFDRNGIYITKVCSTPEESARFFTTRGDLNSEASIAEAFQAALDKFGPVHILIANAGVTDESAHPPIWEIESDLWDKVRERLCVWSNLLVV